ncbi:MAG TPA: group III truncated hemoglobin [Bacteroidia bacterium]|nr:group III truncated hemoglobin [Bacteroidia bacterium]
MKDIENRNDVEQLVGLFYKKAIHDTVIGHFFTAVIPISWEKHIPLIVSFWESILFGNASYRGNPMEKHIELSRLSKMEAHHFERWLKLWKETTDENFAGPKANEAKVRAEAIARLMLHNVQAAHN